MPIKVEYRVREPRSFSGSKSHFASFELNELPDEQRLVVQTHLSLYNQYLAPQLGAPETLSLCDMELLMPAMTNQTSVIENGLTIQWHIFESPLATTAEVILAIDTMNAQLTAVAAQFPAYEEASRALRDRAARTWRVVAVWTHGGSADNRYLELPAALIAEVDALRAAISADMTTYDIDAEIPMGWTAQKNQLRLMTYHINPPTINYPEMELGGLDGNYLRVMQDDDIVVGIANAVKIMTTSWEKIREAWPVYVAARSAAREEYKQRDMAFHLEEDQRYAEEAELNHANRLLEKIEWVGNEGRGSILEVIVATAGIKPESRYGYEVREVQRANTNTKTIDESRAWDSSRVPRTERVWHATGSHKKDGERIVETALVAQCWDGTFKLIPDTFGVVTNGTAEWVKKILPVVKQYIEAIVDAE